MLRDIDLNKKQTDSNFIKSLPSYPGKEFEIKKDKLRNIKRFNKKNNNDNNDNNNNNNNDNNDGGDSGGDLFSPSTNTRQNKNNSFIPEAPTFNDIFNLLPEEYDLEQKLNLQQPAVDYLLQQRLNNLRAVPNPNPPARPEEVPIFANNTPNFQIPAQTSSFNPYR